MPPVKVVILDHTRSKKTLVELPDDIPLRHLLPALTARMHSPLQAGGRPIDYILEHRESGRRLTDEESLAEAGVKPEDTLSLIPEVTAGGPGLLPPPEQLGIIDSIMNSIADLRSRSLDREEMDIKLDSLLAQVTDDNARRYTELLGEIRNQTKIQDAIREINAPVEVPTPEQMKVKLVPSHLLIWLEETRSDENRWSSVGWAFIGAILGIVINWITADQIQITRPAAVVIIAFGIIAALAFFASHQYGRRAGAVRADIMSTGLKKSEMQN
jgi:hypothetical protein